MTEESDGAAIGENMQWELAEFYFFHLNCLSFWTILALGIFAFISCRGFFQQRMAHIWHIENEMKTPQFRLERFKIYLFINMLRTKVQYEEEARRLVL